MATHEQLKAWQVSHELALAVYAATDSWPRAERHGLSSQARREVHAVAANIARGWAKRGRPELCRYLDGSLGALAELSYTLRLARDRKLLSDRDWRALEDLRGTAALLVWRLYRSTRKRSSAPG